MTRRSPPPTPRAASKPRAASTPRAAATRRKSSTTRASSPPPRAASTPRTSSKPRASSSRATRIAHIAIVGLGKAGGALVASAQAARIDVVAKARRVDALLRAKNGAWRQADALFLAVPDDVIAACADALERDHGALPPLVVHLSGAHGPSALASLAPRAMLGAFHPLASLDGKHRIPRGTLVAVDASGPHEALAVAALEALAVKFGCVPARVDEDKRALYHAGAVVAGNLPVALLDMGVRLLVDAGVPAALARVSLARLLRSQAENAVAHDLGDALTGPVARGDAATLVRHLAALDARADEIAAAYRALSSALLERVARHDETARAALRSSLAPRR